MEKYTNVLNKGTVVQNDEPVPDQVKYYRFEKGTIFKIVNGTRFYYLDDHNVWQPDNGSIRRRYFDAQYGWWEIEYSEPGNQQPEKKPPQKTCPKCGKLQEAGYLFCPGCGADLKAVYCTHCGKRLPEDAVFCPYCGRKQE